MFVSILEWLDGGSDDDRGGGGGDGGDCGMVKHFIIWYPHPERLMHDAYKNGMLRKTVSQ